MDNRYECKELKPCPFCGKEAIMFRHYTTFYVRENDEQPKNTTLVMEDVCNGEKRRFYKSELLYKPTCKDKACCGCSDASFETKNKAVEMWNRRAVNDTE